MRKASSEDRSITQNKKAQAATTASTTPTSATTNGLSHL
jgi:hypothetical protein